MPQFQYKKQQFQKDAVDAVVDVFRSVDFSLLHTRRGLSLANPALSSTSGHDHREKSPSNFLLPRFRGVLKNNLQEIQTRNNIQPKQTLRDEPYLALDTHMETGTGKTFTFINTIFELHKQHRLTHFVVIVPSIAIKEGIKKSFDTTATYFERLYQKRITVYEMTSAKSKKGRKSPPSGVMSFIYSQSLTVLIITNHSFNRASNLINQELEGFYADNARTPIEAIAAKTPVLIIDEPQRVEGKQTVARIKNFNPVFVLRYSATFREGQIKNLVYVLDSYDAFNKKLVKNITVTDYKINTANSELLGVQRVFRKNTKVLAEVVAVDKAGNLRTLEVGVDKEPGGGQIFSATENPAYSDLLVIRIDNREKEVEFSSDVTLKLGEYRGQDGANENIVTEVMLRDTIDKHLQKEQTLFQRGIKCISLIFIDRVKDYRNYDVDQGRGYLQDLFEKCYQECKQKMIEAGELLGEYHVYLNRWIPAEAHGGYFSGDAKGNKAIDDGIAEQNNEKARELQQEISELILRNKERVLDPDNKLRFIFAHSALREGWDNPNVFQICKLRSSYSETSVVQEIGRGLRICVDRQLQRQDSETIGNEFSAFNRLDVFTLGNGEFINRLQDDLNARRNQQKEDFILIDADMLMGIYGIKRMPASRLLTEMGEAGCLDDDGNLITKEGIEEILINAKLDPQKLLAKLSQSPNIVDGRKQDSEPKKYRVNPTHYQKFKELWRLLHQKVIYQVKYSEDFERKTIEAIDQMPGIVPIFVTRDTSTLTAAEGIFSEGSVQEGISSQRLVSDLSAPEFLNQLAEKTNLPRNTIIRILSKVNADLFASMQGNPFTAIEQVAERIKNVIYENIMDNIRYIKLNGTRKPETEITLTDREFTARHYLKLSELPNYKQNNLWEDIAPFDSIDPEKKISESALADENITVFAKLPRAVNIPAPMYPKGINPDFAFVVRKQNGDSQWYFVAEAKPTTDTSALRREEERRIAFMQKYFDGIKANVKFRVVSNYEELLTLFKQRGETL